MPAATIANRAVQSSSPEVGSAPGSVSLMVMAGQSSGAQTEAMKQVLGVIDKKVRNMEKKKSKLDDYQAKKNKGERLNQDQLEALSKFQEVANNLEFARELQKSFLALGQDIQKAIRKAVRREQLQREEAEQKRLKSVLELQFLLEKLGEDAVRQDLQLSDQELANLDNLYKLLEPESNPNVRLADQFEQASLHFWELLEGKDKEVAGTTYKSLKETLDKVLQSGYFDKAQTHQNGTCEEEEKQQQEEEEEEEEEPAAAKSPEVEEQSTETEGDFPEEYTESAETEDTEFVNRQFVPETTYSSSDQEEREEWATESEVVDALQQQLPFQSACPPSVPEPHSLAPATPTPTSDPVVRKQTVQDLMAQMQGPYNFMQDSMLEFDGQAIDPAIVSAQPMKPALNMDLPQMVCPAVHSESRTTQPNTVPAQQEPTQVPMMSPAPDTFSTVQPLYQPSHTADPRPQTDGINPVQASMSLSAEQPPATSSLPSVSQPQVFQPVPKPLHSGGINVNAAPFQSMQAVFNLNAPVPPSNEADALKQASQYQSTYSQGFGSQAQHVAEQPELQPDPLQSVVGAFHTQDQAIPSAGSHQLMSQQVPPQGPGFGRSGQSFYNSRAMPRGGPRNPRGVLNGYRGPSNSFRGGYESYRPPFSNAPNSGYGQAQLGTSRDYSNGNYQREGYQQNYKRGASQGPRGCSRGNPQAMRS